MIRIPSPSVPLSSAEAHGLAVLVDLARLVRVNDPSADVVQLLVVGGDTGEEHAVDIHTASPFGRAEGMVFVPRALLRWVTAIAGAGIEQHSVERDRYARVPSGANPVVGQGREREPVVSRIAVNLRQAVVAAAGRRPLRFVAPWPRGARWAAAFTHDLDAVAWWPLFTLLRVAELSRKGHLWQVARVAASATAALGRNPIAAAVRDVLATERELGIASTWFVLCGTPTVRTMRAGDLTYRPESRAARRIFGSVIQAGHEIALHGSFETLESERAFAEQRRRLERIIERPVTGVRQHYLRMNPGISQRAMLTSGFSYNATFGFPDRNGFRLGVCDVVPAWDERAQHATALEEVPLSWMDRALSKYRGVEDPREWVADGLELAAASRAAEGLWVGLWHPNLAPSLGFPGAPAAYRELAREIASERPYIATVSDIVQWRVARRSVSVHRIMGSGTVDARTSVPVDEPLTLEDEHGRARERVSGAGPELAERSASVQSRSLPRDDRS